MSSAKEQVLYTPELFEKILNNLSMSCLLHAQRINRYFHAFITLNPHLQRRLFFEPASKGQCPSGTEINPLLEEKFSFLFFHRRCENGGPCGYGHALVNGRMREVARIRGKDFATVAWKERPEAFRRADASWRRMFVAQPPVPELAIPQLVTLFHSYNNRWNVFAPRDDLKMAMLYDFAWELITYDLPAILSGILWYPPHVQDGGVGHGRYGSLKWLPQHSQDAKKPITQPDSVQYVHQVFLVTNMFPPGFLTGNDERLAMYGEFRSDAHTVLDGELKLTSKQDLVRSPDM